jgi:hypothetical protein
MSAPRRKNSSTDACGSESLGADSLDSDRTRQLRPLLQAEIQKIFAHGELPLLPPFSGTLARSKSFAWTLEANMQVNFRNQNTPYSIDVFSARRKIVGELGRSACRPFGFASRVRARAQQLVSITRCTRFIKRQS